MSVKVETTYNRREDIECFMNNIYFVVALIINKVRSNFIHTRHLMFKIMPPCRGTIGIQIRRIQIQLFQSQMIKFRMHIFKNPSRY